jgi:hypothetical protein
MVAILKTLTLSSFAQQHEQYRQRKTFYVLTLTQRGSINLTKNNLAIMKSVPQLVVLVLITVFAILGYFAGLNHAERNQNQLDLNEDGEVTFVDFSIALYLVNEIALELGAEVEHNSKPNVIEDVYPPVPLPYQPVLKQE